MQNLMKNWLVVLKMTWEIWQIFIRAHQILKTCASKNWQGIWQIFTRALESLKNLNFDGLLLTCAFKNNEEFSKFSPEHVRKSKNWDFDKFWPEHSKISKICTLIHCFWPKYIMLQLKKVQKSYTWWDLRLMQKLKENWLVLSKNFHLQAEK